MSLEFEWDARKAQSNVQKHGVAFTEALTAFADPLAQIFDDPDKAAAERREILVGHSKARRLLIVCFVEREGKIRIISARAATKRERRDYEEST